MASRGGERNEKRERDKIKEGRENQLRQEQTHMERKCRVEGPKPWVSKGRSSRDEVYG